MSLYLEEEGSTPLDLDCQQIADTVIEAALEYCECPYEAEINLLLTTNDAICEMNQMYRQIDRPTDVLSFPMIEYVTAGEFDFLEEREDCFNPETGELMLGDIVISKDKVITQAAEYGHSIKREYAFLIAHSMLHLFGYDHIDNDDRHMMEDKQKEILEKVQILR
ncbi:MAG: rRNA maturation RNase YbeY [Hespellia sp.]|nr:rRNA maturation RNase YbeY [Hespellia sp.]